MPLSASPWCACAVTWPPFPPRLGLARSAPARGGQGAGARGVLPGLGLRVVWSLLRPFLCPYAVRRWSLYTGGRSALLVEWQRQWPGPERPRRCPAGRPRQESLGSVLWSGGAECEQEDVRESRSHLQWRCKAGGGSTAEVIGFPSAAGVLPEL